jgi:hypothetical protein
LDANHPDSAFHRRLLAAFHRKGLPVYAEVDDRDRSITNLRIPLEGKVRFLFRDPEGNLTFHLNNSAKPFELRHTHSEFESYLKILREAQLEVLPVLITEKGDGEEIADIRLSQAEPALHAPQAPPTASPPVLLPVPIERVRELFEDVAKTTCRADSEPGSCIPFLYPDNGCHARAHAMCRILAEHDAQPIKVWNCAHDTKHPLVVETPNSPKGEVRWSFHVAAALAVSVPGTKEPEILVLDPSLFPKPVPVAEWRSVQGDPLSGLIYTSPDPYVPPARCDVEFDFDGQQTEKDLVRYGALLERRIRKLGPPPYANHEAAARAGGKDGGN